MQSEADIKYATDMSVIVRLTNKTDFDFTPEMGARFGGTPHLIRAGESRLFPQPVARHLAKHLARQTFIRKAPIRNESEIDGKGSNRPLWGIGQNKVTGAVQEEEVEARMAAFLSDAYAEEVKAPKSEIDIVNEKISALNAGMATQTPAVTTAAGYKDKADVIAELERRGIKHDKRSSKDKLEELLKA